MLPVVASDTLVELNGRILGKPKTVAEACETLRALSGRKHSVHTGITVIYNGRRITDTVSTDVCFRELSDEEIAFYVDSGEPMDKAGSYGIQSLGSMFVKQISGDYFAVVGLPVCRMTEIFYELGINVKDLRQENAGQTETN